MCNFNPVFEWIWGIFRHFFEQMFFGVFLSKIGSDGTESTKHPKLSNHAVCKSCKSQNVSRVPLKSPKVI